MARSQETRKACLTAQLSEIIGDASKKILLLVPDQSEFVHEKAVLLQYGSAAAGRIRVCGFSRLSLLLLQENGVAVKPQIDEAGRSVLMSLAVENAAGENSLYAAYAGRGKLMGNLLCARDEMRQYCLQPSDLLRVAEQISGASLAQKTKELALIFAAYDALVNERFSDKSDRINMLTQLLKEHDLFSDTVVLAYGFRGFTEQQYRCLEQILKSSPSVHLYLCMEKNAEEEGPFAHSQRARRRLHTICNLRNVPVCEIYPEENKDVPEPFVYLQRGLYDPSADAYESPTQSITVVTATDQYDECSFCAAEAARLLREEGYRARDIAVVERQAGSYAKAIAAAFAQHGVPCFEDQRRPLSEFPLIRLVTAACEAAGNRFSTELLMKALKTGLADLNAEETAALERYAALWQIDFDGWKKPFTGHPQGFGKPLTDADAVQLAELEEMRKRAVLPLLQLRKKLDGANGRQACEAVYSYLMAIHAPDRLRALAIRLDANGNTHAAVESGRIWDVLMQLLDALQDAIGAHTLSARRFSELLHIMIDSADLGDIPDGIDEVSVGDAMRIRINDAKAVFVVGVNDGVFPAPLSDAGVFSQAEKEQLRELEFMFGETPENACAEERLLVYSVLTAPREKLYLTYSVSDLHAKTQYKSEIITQVEKLFPACRRVQTALLAPEERISSVQTAFEAAAKLYRENTPLSATLRAFLQEKPLYADRLKAVERAASGRSFAFADPENAKKLFAEELYLSPSKIELYHKCSFAYFCRYGLRADTPFSAKLDASHRGLLIHFVLEKLLRKYPGPALAQVSLQELRQALHTLCEEYITVFMGGREAMPSRLQWQLDRAEETAFEIAQRLRSEFGTSLFVTKDVELPIRSDGAVAPFTVETADGGKVTVTGVVDRVDVMEADGHSYLRIVDYKTGGKNFKLSDLDAGLNMQMLLYLCCLWNNAKDRYGDIIPAGILYVPAKTGSMPLPRNATVEEIEAQKLKNGKMNGLILADRNVILGMDSTGEGVYINAKIDKKGELKGSIASLDTFVQIHEKIETLIKEMFADLRQGSIYAVPVQGSNYKDICRYCDYASVCCRESTDPVRKLDATGGENTDAVDT